MDPEQRQLLSLMKMPARLNTEQAGAYLGFQPHEVPILVAGGLLKPLGSPPRNGVKHFATTVLDALYHDTKWLARACDLLSRHWKQKNARKSDPASTRVRSTITPTGTLG